MRFLLELASHLHKTVGELLDQMDEDELAYWRAWFMERPLELDRHWYVGAVIAHAAAAGGGIKSKITDFLPSWIR